VRLLELTLIRVGNEEYARSNQSYGLTTLRDNHVKIYGSEIRFRFKGKGGKAHDVGIKDRRLARIVSQCKDIPGQELFQYVNENGECLSVDSSDVNDYIREISGQDFTAKDFRTWAATVLTAMALKLTAEADSGLVTKKQMLQAIETVAAYLRNTPAICRKSYIHPAILDGYLSGKLLEAVKPNENHHSVEGLAPEEAFVLAYLRQTSAI
jgi:DNA topoisomerase-1